MKIGYPCINHAVSCTANRTFRLRSYSPALLEDIIRSNLRCLASTIEYNISHGILFFRIGSGLVPFASHPICKFNWQRHFKQEFSDIGGLIRKNHMRISMHPDQFTLINSPRRDIFKRSVKELNYHAQVLELMNLGTKAKMQIHIGGVYNNKRQSIKRFIERYKTLPEIIKRHLVIENDDRLYTLKDCLSVHRETRIPVLFDVFHHILNNNGETLNACMQAFTKTWREKDGLPMVDYSSQARGLRTGAHSSSISTSLFDEFLQASRQYDFDVMLEIKDKQKSALKAIKLAEKDKRLICKKQI
jgi:UV DNA damage endonuclease